MTRQPDRICNGHKNRDQIPYKKCKCTYYGKAGAGSAPCLVVCVEALSAGVVFVAAAVALKKHR